jgi:short-subunit dehydrogenase
MPQADAVFDTWKDHRVWVIGASTGIGRALAEDLLARGAKVAVSARNAQALADMAKAHGDKVTMLPLDVTDEKAQYSAVEYLNSANNTPQTIIYCAGYYKAMRAEQFDLQEALRHDDVNYRGALITLAAVLPTLLAQGAGRIALVSSVAGYSGLPNSLGYGPTKAALINLAETLHMDLKPRGIRVHLICPGFVDTPLTAQNTFEMPALITPQVAAQEIIRGMERNQFEIHFPKRFTRWLKLMRLLPYSMYFALTKRFTGL